MGAGDVTVSVCAGVRKDGALCTARPWASGQFCRSHQAQGEESAAGESADDVGGEPVEPSAFRGRFSADMAGDYGKIREAVLAALDAKKTVSLSCSHCKRSSKHEISDHRTAVAAAQFAVEQGFGKAPQEKSGASADERLANLNGRWGAHVYTATPAERSEAWGKLLERGTTWFKGLGRLDSEEIGALLLIEIEQWAGEQTDGKLRPGFVEILDAVHGEPPRYRDEASEPAKAHRELREKLVARHDEVLRDLQQLQALKRIKECALVRASDELFPITELRPHQQAAA